MENSRNSVETPDQNKTAMPKVTNAISAMRGLLVSNRFLALLLVCVQLYYVFNHIRLYSALYILLLDLVFPMIMDGMIRGHSAPQNEDDLPLPLLRKKYRYNAVAAKALSFGFLLNIIMLIAWHYNYRTNPPEQDFLQSLPAAILIAYVCVRLLVWIFYLLVFRYAPSKLMK